MAKAKKKTSLKKKKNKSVESHWPQKRNVFFRPERMKYVRKQLENTQGCVFCTSAAQEISIETLCVYKSKHSQIVLNKYPYNNGHLLVLPLQHGGDLLSLSEEVFIDLNNTLRVAAQAIQDVYAPAGFNVGMNHGMAGGAGIPEHLHFHLVPRWKGDLNFFPLIAETKVVVESLEQSYEKLFDYFSKKEVGA